MPTQPSSRALATLDFTSIRTGEVTDFIAKEAIALLGASRAVVWIYRPTLQQLTIPNLPEPTLVSLQEGARNSIFREPAVWQWKSSGTRKKLIEESFGPASFEASTFLAVPLGVGERRLALLLLQFTSSHEASRAMRQVSDFAAQAALALHNAEAFNAARRHEEELQALYATAGELTKKLSFHTVLQAIADRARRLIGSETAYIMLIDEKKQEIYMRFTSGIRRPTFGDIRLELGTGLGGVVARDQHPIYTRVYLNDASITHDPLVDAEVRAEGIKSILGAPMRVGTEVIGVVYVANRSVTSFGDADVYLLSSLADHAAVALENARLYEKATEAVARLNHAHELIRRQYEQLERTESVHNQLTELVLAGKNLHEIVSAVSDLVGEEIIVLDEAGGVRAASGLEDGRQFRDVLKPGVRVAIEKARDGRNTAVANGHLVIPIVAGSDIHGYLLSRSRDSIDGIRPVLEQAARVVALDLLRTRSVREAEERLRGSLIDDLLSNRPPPDNILIERGREMGIDLSRPHFVALIKPVRQDVELRPEIVAAVQRAIPTAIVVGHSGDPLALVPSTERIDERQIVVVLEKELQGMKIFAVVTGECTAPNDYRRSVSEARRSLEFLEKIDNRRKIETLADLKLLSLLFSRAGQEDVRAFVDRTLGPLIEYDREHGTDLVATAEAYLSKLGNLAGTAATCHVHVNTIYYRLDRIKKILGADWNTPRQLPDLQIAFLARRLL